MIGVKPEVFEPGGGTSLAGEVSLAGEAFAKENAKENLGRRPHFFFFFPPPEAGAQPPPPLPPRVPPPGPGSQTGSNTFDAVKRAATECRAVRSCAM